MYNRLPLGQFAPMNSYYLWVNYDYYNQKSKDYTDDYSQELNDYYGNQNLIAPPTSPIPPPFIYDILPLDILPWNT